MSETFEEMIEYIDPNCKPNIHGGHHYVYKFPNGYGASVISTDNSYGKLEFWELAVLKYEEDGTSDLCYSTEITSDVLGWLSVDEVVETMKKILKLEIK